MSTIPSTQNVLEESDTRVRRLGVRALSWLDAMKGMYRYMSLIPPAWQQAKSLFEAFSPPSASFFTCYLPKKIGDRTRFSVLRDDARGRGLIQTYQSSESRTDVKKSNMIITPNNASINAPTKACASAVVEAHLNPQPRSRRRRSQRGVVP